MYHYKVYINDTVVLDSSLIEDFDGYETPQQAHKQGIAAAFKDKLYNPTVVVYPVIKSGPITLEEAIGASREIGYTSATQTMTKATKANRKSISNLMWEQFQHTDRQSDQIVALSIILTYLSQLSV